MRTKIILLLTTYSLILTTLIGCEAFVKKFTRKPKVEKPPEEMVLTPQEYPSLYQNKEEAYRQYFLFWKSWQDQLISALLSVSSHKKQLSCIDEAIKNLEELKTMLNEEKQEELEPYLAKMDNLRENISRDIYFASVNSNRYEAEKIKRNILRDFSYSHVKDYLR